MAVGCAAGLSIGKVGTAGGCGRYPIAPGSPAGKFGRGFEAGRTA